MGVVALFTDAFGRVTEQVHRVADGLDADGLAFRPDPRANSIAWLIWHLSRVQDDHLAELAGREQAWTAEGWARRFALPFPDACTGYGHTPEQVAAVTPDGPDVLVGYHDAVAAHLPEDLRATVDAGLERIIDASYDPPVSAGVRLVSVLDDATQHVGQAAYVRGLLDRLRG